MHFPLFSRRLFWTGALVFGWLGFSAGAQEPISYDSWAGEWDGSMTVYGVTGDVLDTLTIQRSCTLPDKHGDKLLRITVVAKSKSGRVDRYQGFFFRDKGPSGERMRRVLKTEKGDEFSDLRGRAEGTSKIYWYAIDSRGMLRESYLESFEGPKVRVYGFYWDGVRSGSYRLIEAVYQKKSS